MNKAALGSTVKVIVLVAAACVVAGTVFQLTGYSMMGIFRSTWTGAITGPNAFHGTVRWTIPLFIIALGVFLSFRAGFFNVGAQGQFYAGAIAATAVAIYIPASFGAFAVAAAICAGMAAGGAWSLIAGFLRVRYDTDEVLTTLMLNAIAVLLLDYVTAGPLKDPSGSGVEAASKPVPSTLRLTDNFGVSVSVLLIAALTFVAVYLITHRTSIGFESDLAGRNATLASWQGISTTRVGLAAFAGAGLTAGLAGCLEILGPSGRASTGFSPGVGFTSILVALIAGRSVLAIIPAALLFGAMQSASLFLPIATGLPTSGLQLLSGAVTMIITVAALPPLARLRGLHRIGAVTPLPSART